MKQLAYIVALLLLTFYSCSEKWDEHYGDGEKSEGFVSSLNLLDYLKSNAEYSKFVEVLERTGVAEELTRNQDLTVWAVKNDAMDALASMTAFTDTFIIQYHVNNLSFGKAKLADGLRMRSLNGKYISVSSENDQNYVADSKVITSDQFCKNGVVHEIEQLMVPVISLYEYLQTLGPNYSTIVDTIFNANRTIFDVENSAPIGVDVTGNTVYDSVFVIQNPLFEQVDFRSEFEQITMFLPDNDVIDNCLATLGEQLKAMGKPFVLADTVMAMNWITEALFYEGLISDYHADIDLISVYDRVWRTTIQHVNPDFKKMSNGLIYTVSKMKVPNNVYITRIKSLVHYYEFTDSISRPDLIQFYNVVEPIATNAYPKTTDSWNFVKYGYGSGVYKILYMRGMSARDDLNLGVEFSPLKIETLPDNSIQATEMLIPAGEYKLYFGFQSKNHPYINVYFNGSLIKEDLNVDPSNPWNYDRVTETVVPKYDGLGGLVEIVNVDGEGLQHVKFKIEFNRLGKGSSEELKIYHWALVPTENNY